MAALGVSQSSAFAPDANKAKDSAASIFGILDRKSKIDSSVDEGTVLANVRGDIEFKHVSFKYLTRPDVQIFRDLCLSIPSGKVRCVCVCVCMHLCVYRCIYICVCVCIERLVNFADTNTQHRTGAQFVCICMFIHVSLYM